MYGILSQMKKKITKKITLGNVGQKLDIVANNLDAFALMTKRGFDEVRSEMKTGFIDVRSEMKIGFKEVNDRLDDIDNRLSKIENNHGRRLDNLEDKVRIFATIFEKDLKIKLPKGV